MEDDDIIRMAGLAAFLTGYAVTRGATEVADTVFETVADVGADGTEVIKKLSKNPVLYTLGYGRKGGIL